MNRTGDQTYADRALNVWMSKFDGNPDILGGHMDGGGYFAVAYDLLHDNPSMTQQMRTNWTNLMIGWVDQAWARDNYGLSAYSTDSDHNAALGWTAFAFGVVIYGESARAQELMDRGYYVWINGMGSSTSIVGSIPVSYDQYLTESLAGVPLPGFEYGMGTDLRDIAAWWSTMRNLGYNHRATHRIYWQNLIKAFFYAISPDKNIVYHAGDSQDPPVWTSTHYAHSFLSNAAYLANQEGYTQWSSYGRGLSQYLHTRTYGDADDFLAFVRADNNSAVNPWNANIPKFFCPSVGLNTYCTFRSSWAQNATWVGFAVSGSTPVDHQVPDSGSFWIWSRDSYVTSPARTYLGYDYPIFTNLAIPNPGAPNHAGNPMIFDRASPSRLNRTRLVENSGSGQFAYLMMNGDGIYNQHSPTVYNAVQPVNSYRRHFFYTPDSDIVVIVDRAALKAAAVTQFRMRNANKNTAPTANFGTINLPSASGNARLIVKVLRESDAEQTVISIDDEATSLAAAQDYEVPTTERGYAVRIASPSSTSHNWISVMSVKGAGAAATDLDDLIKIPQSDGSGMGVYTNGWALLFANNENLRAGTLNYTVSANSAVQAVVYHLVADMAAGCYSVTINGANAYFSAQSDDNTLLFSAPSAGLPHSVSIVPASINTCGAAPPRDNGGFIPVALNPPRAVASPTATPKGANAGPSGGGNRPPTSGNNNTNSATNMMSSCAAVFVALAACLSVL
jgi:hypothetical protein